MRWARGLVLFVLMALAPVPPALAQTAVVHLVEARGSLTRDRARQVLRGALPRLARCAAGPEQRAAVSLEIQRGRVVSSGIYPEATSDREAGRCVERVLGAVRFPKVRTYRSGIVIVSVGLGSDRAAALRALAASPDWARPRR